MLNVGGTPATLCPALIGWCLGGMQANHGQILAFTRKDSNLGSFALSPAFQQEQQTVAQITQICRLSAEGSPPYDPW